MLSRTYRVVVALKEIVTVLLFADGSKVYPAEATSVENVEPSALPWTASVWVRAPHEVDGGSFLPTKVPWRRYRDMAVDPYIAPGSAYANELPIVPGKNIEATAGLNDEVREIQAKLESLGHDPGPVDGIFGPQTVSAVKRYEIAIGREPTGTIDLRLLERLRQEP